MITYPLEFLKTYVGISINHNSPSLTQEFEKWLKINSIEYNLKIEYFESPNGDQLKAGYIEFPNDHDGILFKLKWM